MEWNDALPLIFSALAVLFAFGIFLWGFLALLLKSFQAMLDAKIEPVTKDIARLEAGQAKLEANQAKLEANQAKLEANQVKLEAKLAKLEAKLERALRAQERFEIELKEIKSALHQLLARKP